jgi:hypothetical protein
VNPSKYGGEWLILCFSGINPHIGFPVWFCILEKKQRHIFWFLSFSSRAVIKRRNRGKKGRRLPEWCCSNKLAYQIPLNSVLRVCWQRLFIRRILEKKDKNPFFSSPKTLEVPFWQFFELAVVREGKVHLVASKGSPSAEKTWASSCLQRKQLKQLEGEINRKYIFQLSGYV